MGQCLHGLISIYRRQEYLQIPHSWIHLTVVAAGLPSPLVALLSLGEVVHIHVQPPLSSEWPKGGACP